MSSTQTPGPIANRLQRIKDGDDPQMIAKLRSGYVILGKYQPDPIVGACMLIPDPVVPSLNDLDHDARAAFLTDFALIGDAILGVTKCERINYLILCNQVPELHAHAIPRFASEDPTKRLQGPFEAYDFGSARVADAMGQDRELFEALRDEINRLTA
jgi:diadenosine tetraphosphate (Ap4A) HIT family hydrolase